MKIINMIILLLLIVKAMAQNDTTTIDFFNQMKTYDLSNVINADSIIDDANERHLRAEILGFIDTTYQRFQIHFTYFRKDNKIPYKYLVNGKTRVKNITCEFEGSIILTKARLLKQNLDYLGFLNWNRGYLICTVELNENKNQPSSGFIKGNLIVNFLIDSDKKIRYDALMAIADGFCNNQFEGFWTSYKSGKSKICNWGDYRIPNSQNLDWGTGEFSPNEKYLDHGWRIYHDYFTIPSNNPKWNEIQKIEEMEWWK